MVMDCNYSSGAGCECTNCTGCNNNSNEQCGACLDTYRNGCNISCNRGCIRNCSSCTNDCNNNCLDNYYFTCKNHCYSLCNACSSCEGSVHQDVIISAKNIVLLHAMVTAQVNYLVVLYITNIIKYMSYSLLYNNKEVN